jgi:alpha-glucosidase
MMINVFPRKGEEEMKECLFMAALVCAALGSGAETLSVKSPDGKNEIRLAVGNDLQIEVSRNGKTRIAPTPIAMTVDGKGTIGMNPKLSGQKSRTLNSVLKTPTYKKAEIAENGNELAASFEGGYKVILHARNDGVAYRFATEFGGTVKVMDEEAGLAFPSPDLTAFVGYNWGNSDDPKQDKLQNSWESIYVKTPVSKIAADKSRLVYLPLLLQYDDGVCVCVTESDLLDYPGWNLYRKGSDNNKLSAWMAKYPVLKTVTDDQRQRHIHEREAWLAETQGTRTFPWRVFVMADEPAKLVEQDIVMALATPNKIGNANWVKPGKVAWDWWNDWNVSHVPFRAGCNTATYKYYIDFAQKNGIEYVIFDEGWSVHLKIMEVSPDVNVPELIAYGKERGVGIILWCAWSQLVDRQEEVLSKYAAMGAKGFKIDFMDRDDQFVVDFLEKTAAVAAKYNLLVDYHGMFKPTGMQRTYPNIINFEGVHGLEQLKWENGSDFPAHDCQIAFTRMVAGPLDYTPGSMLNQNKQSFRACGTLPTSQGTRCHQMALMTLFEAPLQMLCDSPTQYMRNQECTDFMGKVPTVWDETVGLVGKVGEYAAVARRKGDVWYVSAINNWNARQVKLPTAFLGGGEWKAEIFADGINADRDATDYVKSVATVKTGDDLTINMASGGGWTARLTK